MLMFSSPEKEVLRAEQLAARMQRQQDRDDGRQGLGQGGEVSQGGLGRRGAQRVGFGTGLTGRAVTRAAACVSYGTRNEKRTRRGFEPGPRQRRGLEALSVRGVVAARMQTGSTASRRGLAEAQGWHRPMAPARRQPSGRTAHPVHPMHPVHPVHLASNTSIQVSPAASLPICCRESLVASISSLPRRHGLVLLSVFWRVWVRRVKCLPSRRGVTDTRPKLRVVKTLK